MGVDVYDAGSGVALDVVYAFHGACVIGAGVDRGSSARIVMCSYTTFCNSDAAMCGDQALADSAMHRLFGAVFRLLGTVL